MSEHGPESNGGTAAVESRAGTPRGELARLRATQARQTNELRERIMEAMLVATGRRGYRAVAVRDVLEAYGGHRVQFYSYFANKEECYAAAYEAAAERLYATLFAAAARQPSWCDGLREALAELARFACADPDYAKGLLAEVHVAGGPALAKRDELLERLATAVDGARLAADASHSPPPVTATFMVSAIESSLVSTLSRGKPESFAAATPELAQMVIAAYFGDEVASAEEVASADLPSQRAA